ncbi:MAG: threonine/serine dehydratase [Herpetosiphon sp.]
MLINLEDIRTAQRRLHGIATYTPLLLHRPANAPGPLFIKPEGFQPTGSFKIRGAYNKCAGLTPEQRARGIVAYSSGNHALGVAYAARALGAPATIVMPSNAPNVKLERVRALGASVVIVGPGGEERRIKGEAIAAETGAVLVPPFDDPAIIAGQGTIGLEILADLPDLDLVLVPVGGGGLISGIAAAIKLVRPSVKVVGVEPAMVADAQASFRSGTIASLTPEQTTRTIADGLRTQQVSELTFAHIKQFVDDIITVNETEIRSAMRQLALMVGLVAEPSGAVTHAAYLYHQAELPQHTNIVTIMCGANADPRVLADVIMTPEMSATA